MSDREFRPPFYLGVDLGGTNIKSGVVDDSGRPRVFGESADGGGAGPSPVSTPWRKWDGGAVEASGLGWDAIAAVGLGSPGTMDLPRGLLLDPPNLPGWQNLPIRDLLAGRLGKPTVLQNDGNAAAYGEYWAGAGRKRAVSSSSRSAPASVAESSRKAGSSKADIATVGECGHIIIQMDNARECSCGAFGHLEAYASATALVKRAPRP